MAPKPRAVPTPPDGAPAPAVQDRDATTRSKVTEVQDPAISGDAGATARDGTVDARVDQSGNIRRETPNVDLLN